MLTNIGRFEDILENPNNYGMTAFASDIVDNTKWEIKGFIENLSNEMMLAFNIRAITDNSYPPVQVLRFATQNAFDLVLVYL